MVNSPENNEANEEKLWFEYKKTKDQKIRDAFIEQYSPLVRYVAGKVAGNLPKSVEFEDLVSCGIFGLLDAIEKYDPTKNVKFKTYAHTRIKGAIFDELRSSDWVPRSVRTKIKEVEDAIGHLEAKAGRPATDREIAQYLKMDEAEFNRVMLKISGTTVLSLSDVWVSGDENDKMSIGDSIESPPALNPDVIVERNEIRKIVFDTIKQLPDKEKKIVVLYHYRDLTLKEIGQVLNITESRVSQLHSKALMRIRAKLSNFRKGIT
jgi:RNA polymerase sigma factor for flagellar operon FliA